MIKVEGYTNLYRDENSGAIINCDSTAYNQYLNSISKQELKKKELDEIKNDIHEIKTLLKELLNK
jgi:beta-lactamase class A